MRKRVALILMVITATLIGCKGRGGEEKAKLEPPKMVTPPAIIDSQEGVNSYMASHFWDNVSFEEQSLMKYSAELRRFFQTYLQVLSATEQQVAEKSLTSWSEKVVAGEESVKEFLLDLTERNLFDPNSPYRNDHYYSIVLEKVVEDETLLPIVRDRYREQLNLAQQNREGTKANNFTLITTKGLERELSSFQGRESLILFYDLDCPICKEAFNYFNLHPNIEKIAREYNLIAIYSGADYDSWGEELDILTSHWVVAHDKDRMIELERLYDRRPSPSFYLLDSDLTVLMKDGTLHDLLYHPLIGIPNESLN